MFFSVSKRALFLTLVHAQPPRRRSDAIHPAGEGVRGVASRSQVSMCPADARVTLSV